jgi:hypothetical protein
MQKNVSANDRCLAIRAIAAERQTAVSRPLSAEEQLSSA